MSSRFLMRRWAPVLAVACLVACRDPGPASAGAPVPAPLPPVAAPADAPAVPASAPASAPQARLPRGGPDCPGYREVGTEDADYSLPGAKRARNAWRDKEATARCLFDAAGVGFPASRLLLRVFKQENEMEVWASSGARDPLRHVATYQVCRMSSGGPKRREHDGNVPEGFYVVDSYNEASTFYLALHVSYPNRADLALGDAKHPGHSIMIHGRCVSAGCVAMSDERIQELWVMADSMRRKGRRADVHIFPSRDPRALARGQTDAAIASFWENLAEGMDVFERTRRIPAISVAGNGRYAFR